MLGVPWCSSLLPCGAKNDLHHPLPVFVGHAGSGGEAEVVREELLGHAAAHDRMLGEDGLEVHGLPDGPGLDVGVLEGQAQVLAGRAEGLGVDLDAGEPESSGSRGPRA